MSDKTGFKGFDKDWKCNGFQYEVGKTYETKEDIRLCEKGFHFCENPLDVFSYYPPTESKFAEVEADKYSKEKSEDSKIVCSSLHIKAELSLQGIISAGVKFILDKVDWKNDKKTNTGNWSAATNTGDRSAATNTGNWSAAEVSGKDSIACGLGYANKAKGAKGCWLVLAERKDDHAIKTVKAIKIDGKKIKADTWHELKNGKFVEVE